MGDLDGILCERVRRHLLRSDSLADPVQRRLLPLLVLRGSWMRPDCPSRRLCSGMVSLSFSLSRRFLTASNSPPTAEALLFSMLQLMRFVI